MLLQPAAALQDVVMTALQCLQREDVLSLCVGELLLHCTAASLLEAIALADPEELADITAGFSELRHLGYAIADEQLQLIHSRKEQLQIAQ